MEKKKKIIIFILILFIIVVIGSISFAIIYHDNTTVEVLEISALIEKFEIESNTHQISLNENEENVKSDINETEESISNKKKSSSKKNSNSKKSTGSSSSANGSNGSSGGSTYVGAAGSYTPKIRIPRTGVTCTIFYDMTIRNMEKGVVILSTDNGLNEPGNTVISGHNRHNSRLFSKNMRLQAGDIIYITDESGQEVAYSVFSKFLTDPNDASYMERDTDGGRQISLTTCTDDNEARLVILADEI